MDHGVTAEATDDLAEAEDLSEMVVGSTPFGRDAESTDVLEFVWGVDCGKG